MAEYEPVSRRPIAAVFRATARAATNWCVRRNVHPDTISYCSMGAAALAAFCFWQARWFPVLLIVAPLLCYLRLWCNMLDGMVAMAGGKASARGEILNDLPDRVSDIVIFAGVAHGGFANPIVAYWAAIFAVLTAYVGLFGQAVGVQREFNGVMSKPWRMVALHLGAWATALCLKLHGGPPLPGHCRFLSWACLFVIAGCLQTIYIRLQRIMVALENRSR
jgi:phosphatidylglycerophosphate synthase